MATAVAVPNRSLDQRMAALEVANEVRIYRSRVKRDVAAGRKRVADLVVSGDPLLDTMRVYDLLLAAPKLGRVKVNRILMRHQISPSKTIGGLSERQRRELAAGLR